MIPGEWLVKKIRQLYDLTTSTTENIENLNVDTKIDYNKGGWTVLKLISLRYMLSVYCPIIKRWKNNKDIVYLDMLSGSGLNLIRGKSQNQFKMLGSALIPVVEHNDCFTKMIFIERNKRKRKVLKERLSNLQNTSTQLLVPDISDANNIEEILSLIPKNSHLFTFVDNEGFDVNWNTISKLLSGRNGDILINYPTTIPSRVQGYYVSESAQHPEKAYKTMKAFFEDNITCSTDSEMGLKMYEYSLKKLRSETTNIKIKSQKGERYYYHLIYAAKRTIKGSRWIDSFRNELKPKIEAMSGEDVERVMEVVAGNQSAISDFYKIGDSSAKSLDDYGMKYTNQ